ncbi:MAG: hypothetical protein ABSE45_04830 [Candidatus Acidiferrales bacterium]
MTKIYNEALATYALLRKTGAEGERPVRVKVSKTGTVAELPGFTYMQDSGNF